MALKKHMQKYTDTELREIYRQGEETTVAFMKTLLQRLEALEHQVEQLTRRVSKTSRTSSKPPSSDGYAKRQSLRHVSGKPPGREKGHPGDTLEMRATPDDILIHRVAENPATPLCCPCGTPVFVPEGEEFALSVHLTPERRQVFDLPPPRLVVVEHRVEVHHCPSCGKEHRGAFPQAVASPVQFGERFTAAAALVNQHHCLPVYRSAELLGDLFGHQVSSATIQAMAARTSAAIEPSLAVIKDNLRAAEVAHADETGAQCEGLLIWLHSLSTTFLTYIEPHKKRGSAGFNAIGLLPEFRGILAHDCFPPYFALDCEHALCNAHLLRELLAFAQGTPLEAPQVWASDLVGFLRASWHETKAFREQGVAPSAERTQAFENEYIRLIQQGLLAHPFQSPSPPTSAADGKKRRGTGAQSDEHKLLKRLHHWAGAVTRFWYDARVPFDNNQAERDIRMTKVQQKVSGCFRTFAGAQIFCRIRSYCSTVSKHGASRMQELTNALQGKPFLPTMT